jgi:hypothetical protein
MLDKIWGIETMMKVSEKRKTHIQVTNAYTKEVA